MTRWNEAQLTAFLTRGKMPESTRAAAPRESLSHRGEGFEAEINATNLAYLTAGIANIYKLPTPARTIYKGGKPELIRLASTVDYLGTWAGPALAIEAKSTQEDRWSLSLIEEHQQHFLQDWHRCGGVAGVLLRFQKAGRTFWLPINELLDFMERKVRGGRKSIALLEMPERLEVRQTRRAGLDYLATIEGVMRGANT